MPRIRTYSELRRLETLKERFEYLKLVGVVGDSTFGFDRWMNQQFYTSTEWRHIRQHVIARDGACDLGIEGYEIHNRPSILDPEFLITVSNRTHNAVHWGDERQLPRPFVERRPGDTKLW
jgi:hypothetical protein